VNIKEKQDKLGTLRYSSETSNAQKNIFYKGVKMYNALPSEIRQCERLE